MLVTSDISFVIISLFVELTKLDFEVVASCYCECMFAFSYTIARIVSFAAKTLNVLGDGPRYCKLKLCPIVRMHDCGVSQHVQCLSSSGVH